MKRRLLRTLVVCAAISIGGSLAAAESYTYIVVLHERVAAGEKAEPDIAALGGEVLHRSRNRRVVRVPAAAAHALATHRAVSYMQRVQTSGEVPALPQSRMFASNAVAANDSTPPTWSSGDYVYDGDGNITAVGADSYAYDSAMRLVSASLTDGATQSEQYTYDSFGNLVNTTRTAGPSTSTPASTATNRLTNATYDSAGNVATSESGTTQYIYDGFNMLRFMDTSTTLSGNFYVYTAADERVGVNEDGEKRWMIRDLSGKVLREWEESGPVWGWREDYVYRNGSLAAAERETAEGGTRHFHIDHLGTARLITDPSSTKISLHDYFPFGVEKTDFRQEMLDRGTHWPNSMKFTGHERDFVGGITSDNRNQLDYMHARYYSAVWGRFLSVDPTWESADLGKPQSWNRYAYVENNPMNFTDPDGRLKDPRDVKPEELVKQISVGVGTGLAGIVTKIIADYVLPDGDEDGAAKSTDAPPPDQAVVPVIMGNRKTPPTVPDKVLATDGNVTIEHNYKSNDHAPAHAHVKGGGPETRIGPNGHPIHKDPPMTPAQRQVYDANKNHVRRSINKIGRWLAWMAKNL